MLDNYGWDTEAVRKVCSKAYYDPSIRGGISWPKSRAPAYFCILGQEYVRPGNFHEIENEAGKR